jgi:hypothetical protein
VVLFVGEDRDLRYLIPACGRIVLDESGSVKPLDRSAPLPPGSVEVWSSLPGHFETATVEAMTITSQRITNGLYPSPPPCEGVPPDLWRHPPTPRSSPTAGPIPSGVTVATPYPVQSLD